MLSPTQPQKTPKTLGPLITIYGDRKLRWRDLTTRYIPGALIALLPFFYGLWRVYLALTRFGPAAGYSWGRPWFLLSAAALIPIVALMLRRIRRSRRLVLVHQNGLQIKQNRRSSQAIFWRELSGITTHRLKERFLWIPLSERFKAVLHPHIGKPVKLDPRIPHLDELSLRIKGKIYPHLLGELRDQRSAGKNLYFGPVTLTPEGINLRGKPFPWRQVSQIDIRKGFLVAEMVEARPKKIPVREIPNIEILIQLIQEGVVV